MADTPIVAPEEKEVNTIPVDPRLTEKVPVAPMPAAPQPTMVQPPNQLTELPLETLNRLNPEPPKPAGAYRPPGERPAMNEKETKQYLNQFAREGAGRVPGKVNPDTGQIIDWRNSLRYPYRVAPGQEAA